MGGRKRVAEEKQETEEAQEAAKQLGEQRQLKLELGGEQQQQQLNGLHTQQRLLGLQRGHWQEEEEVKETQDHVPGGLGGGSRPLASGGQTGGLEVAIRARGEDDTGQAARSR